MKVSNISLEGRNEKEVYLYSKNKLIFNIILILINEMKFVNN